MYLRHAEPQRTHFLEDAYRMIRSTSNAKFTCLIYNWNTSFHLDQEVSKGGVAWDGCKVVPMENKKDSGNHWHKHLWLIDEQVNIKQFDYVLTVIDDVRIFRFETDRFIKLMEKNKLTVASPRVEDSMFSNLP